ncbi:MAG TPA: ATP-binding cassette domain-containing protein [Streptosporangiaceae bacterium]
MAIIESRGLGRTFKSKRGTVAAVSGVDLSVAAGEIVGFLGPNGAGKTTTFRMLTTLLRPTCGTARVVGADLLRDPVGVRAGIGFVPQAVGAVGGGSDPNSTPREELVLQGKLYRKPAAESVRRAEMLIRQLDLSGFERRLIKTLSGGQRRRLDIALGLVHSPRVIFLDEPSTGLDPQSRSNLWEHIRRLREDFGATVFLSTHYLDEADALCDRVLVIDHGKVIAEGRPEDLKQRVSGDVITLHVDGDPGLVQAALGGRLGIGEIARDGGTLRVTVQQGGRAIPELVRILDAAGVTLTSIQLVSPTLDDVFLTLTGRCLRDGSPSGQDGPAPAGIGPDGPAPAVALEPGEHSEFPGDHSEFAELGERAAAREREEVAG